MTQLLPRAGLEASAMRLAATTRVHPSALCPEGSRTESMDEVNSAPWRAGNLLSCGLSGSRDIDFISMKEVKQIVLFSRSNFSSQHAVVWRLPHVEVHLIYEM